MNERQNKRDSTQKLLMGRELSSKELAYNFRSTSSSKLLSSSLNDDKGKFSEIEMTATTKKPIIPHKRVGARSKSVISSNISLMKTERPCQNHSFITDATDVRQMEQGLLSLLGDFNSGKLSAFDCSYEKMEKIREQQEKLAKLHFEIGAQQDIHRSSSEEGRRIAKENFSTLIENLENLSKSIEQLHSAYTD